MSSVTTNPTPDAGKAPHPAAAYHDRRRAEGTAKVLDAARAVLAEHGLQGLTIERVVQCSGVAKTTIYRRYSHRLELAAAAVFEGEEYEEALSDVLSIVRAWCAGDDEATRAQVLLAVAASRTMDGKRL